MLQAAQMAGWIPQDSKDKDAPPPTPRVDHVGFGLVLGDDGKRFRTRSSEVVRLVDLLDEAKTRCKQQMVERGAFSKPQSCFAELVRRWLLCCWGEGGGGYEIGALGGLGIMGGAAEQ